MTDLHSRTGADTFSTRTIIVGGLGKTELLDRLREQEVRLNAAANALFADPRFVTSEVASQLEVVEVSVAGLGIHEGATFEQICTAAQSRNLGLCPLELGPHFRLQYLDQPEGFIGHPPSQHQAPPGSITIASQPLCDDDQVPKGFYLRRIEGILWLRGYWSGLDHLWSPVDRLVFLRHQLLDDVRG